MLISLPVHLGGLGIVIPSQYNFNTSLQVTKPLVDLIVEQSSSYPIDTILNQQSIKSQVKHEISAIALKRLRIYINNYRIT